MRIVGEKQIALARGIRWVTLEEMLHQAFHRGKMDGQRVFGLNYLAPLWIDDHCRVVVAFLNIGRIGATHKRNVGFVGNRTQRVKEDLQRHRIKFGEIFGHAASSSTRLPVGCTTLRSPGKTIVVASS